MANKAVDSNVKSLKSKSSSLLTISPLPHHCLASSNVFVQICATSLCTESLLRLILLVINSTFQN